MMNREPFEYKGKKYMINSKTDSVETTLYQDNPLMNIAMGYIERSVESFFSGHISN